MPVFHQTATQALDRRGAEKVPYDEEEVFDIGITDEQGEAFLLVVRRYALDPNALKLKALTWANSCTDAGVSPPAVGIFIYGVMFYVESAESSTTVEGLRKWRTRVAPMLKTLREVADIICREQWAHDQLIRSLEKARNIGDVIRAYDVRTFRV
jgi:hypothetical protein